MSSYASPPVEREEGQGAREAKARRDLAEVNACGYIVYFRPFSSGSLSCRTIKHTTGAVRNGGGLGRDPVNCVSTCVRVFFFQVAFTPKTRNLLVRGCACGVFVLFVLSASYHTCYGIRVEPIETRPCFSSVCLFLPRGRSPYDVVSELAPHHTSRAHCRSKAEVIRIAHGWDGDHERDARRGGGRGRGRWRGKAS